MNKNIFIFHHNDLDGYVSAAIVLAYYYNDKGNDKINTKMVVCDYNHTVPKYDAVNKWLNTVEGPGMIYLVDLSLNDDMVKEILLMLEDPRISSVTIIDHHQSGQLCYSNHHAELDKYIDSKKLIVYIDINKCAAINVAKYYKIGIRLFLIWVDDYDRWIHGHKESMFINYAFYSMLNKPKPDIYAQLINCICADEDSINNMLTMGAAIAAYKESTNKQWEPFIYTREFEGLKVAVLNYKLTNSSVFPDEIYKKYDAVITWGYNGTIYQYSIYSSKNTVNCAAIAEKYGGGGHKGAAGFTCAEFLLK